MKKVIAVVLALVMVLSLTGCGNSAMKEVSGTYTGVKTKFVGDSEWSNEEFSIELKSKGKGTFNRNESSFYMTWTLDGDKFTMQETFLGMTNDYTGTIKDGVLDIFNGDHTNDFT